MDEGAALEMLCGGNFTEGSNPSLSAIFFAKKWRTKPSVYALAGYAVTSKASLHAFVPTKALHSKPKVFFTSSPIPEALLVKSFALLTCEVFSLREYGWCFILQRFAYMAAAALIFFFSHAIFLFQRRLLLWLKASCAHYRLILRYKF